MKKIPVWHALIVFLIWIGLTMVPGLIMRGGEHVELGDTVSKQFSVGIFSAMVFLLLYIFIRGCGERTGLTKTGSFKTWLLIYPAFSILVGLVISVYLGAFSDTSSTVWRFINTAFVGVSEETMFRGILLSAFLPVMRFWKSVILMSLLFGGVHILNAFTTGELGLGMAQAGLATFSGLLFVAVRVKTLSLIPAIVFHWFWDFATLNLSTFSSGDFTGGTDPQAGIKLIAMAIMVIGPVIFGITGLIMLFNKKAQADFMATQGEG